MSNIMHDSRIAKYGVNCPTEAEANELFEHWYDLGYTWRNGASLKKYNRWRDYLADTIYFLKDSMVSYADEADEPTITFAQYKANGFKFEGVNYNNEGVNAENEGLNGYESLRKELNEAFDRASKGKGHERHANGKAFDQQPIIGLNDILNSLDGALFQIMKKCAEIQNIKEPERKLKEMDDVIVYGAATKILIRKLYADSHSHISDNSASDKAGV